MDREWRLICDESVEAAKNMAIDQAIHHAVIIGNSPSTLRLYGWEKPAVSVGHFQKICSDQIDLGYCSAMGIDIVRRPTGGRAVLHGHDITFSVALRESQLPCDCKSITLSHAWLMQGVLEAMRLLGIHADLGGGFAHPDGIHSPDCFAQIAPCDLRIGLEKAVGAAQLRRSGGLLEQGSIPHTQPRFDPMRIFPRQASCNSLALKDISRRDIEDAIVAGYENSLGLHLTPSGLTSIEVSIAGELSERGCTA
jgi:lipoyl(octanoyl) transferase